MNARQALVLSVFLTTLTTIRVPEAYPQVTSMELLSKSSDSTVGNLSSSTSSISMSSDAQRIVFSSNSTNLVVGDTNGHADVFVRDRQANTTAQVSYASNGTQGNENSDTQAISSDGNVVCFVSGASNLVPSDTNARPDVFVRDLTSGDLSRVDVSYLGAEGDGGSSSCALSADGRYVLFTSASSNLVSSEVTGGESHVYVRDRQQQTTEVVDVGPSGTPNRPVSGEAISADGRYVVFTSPATNILPAADGGAQVFIKDRQTSEIVLASVSASGVSAETNCFNPTMSADGEYVAFSSRATNLVARDSDFQTSIFLYRRSTGTISIISTAQDGTPNNGDAVHPAISADGHYIAFSSNATNLLPGVSNGKFHIYVKHRDTGTIIRVSQTTDGTIANDQSDAPFVSGDGAYVGFISNSTNLAGADTHSAYQVYLAQADYCPNDPGKTAPGVCGCGVADTDTDGDGTPDCNDSCPGDATKIAAGACGCGVPDTDTDGDGTPDCTDLCPNDATKVAPGACGCGASDLDTDGDGTADCNDLCPNDLSKIEPGICGCGVSEADSDHDGIPDCVEPNKNTKPAKPKVSPGKGRATITMDTYTGVSYKLQLRYGTAPWRYITSKRFSVKVSGLSKGSYSACYKIYHHKVATKLSACTKFKVR